MNVFGVDVANDDHIAQDVDGPDSLRSRLSGERLNVCGGYFEQGGGKRCYSI